MAVTFKVRVGDLLAEFFTDALVLLAALQPAGTVTAGTLQSISDYLYHFLIFIEPYCHNNTSFRLHYTGFSTSVKEQGFPLPFSLNWCYTKEKSLEGRYELFADLQTGYA